MSLLDEVSSSLPLSFSPYLCFLVRMAIKAVVTLLQILEQHLEPAVERGEGKEEREGRGRREGEGMRVCGVLLTSLVLWGRAVRTRSSLLRASTITLSRQPSSRQHHPMLPRKVCAS